MKKKNKIKNKLNTKIVCIISKYKHHGTCE